MTDLFLWFIYVGGCSGMCKVINQQKLPKVLYLITPVWPLITAAVLVDKILQEVE